MKKDQKGFSIAELSVTMVVTGVMIGTIMMFALNYQRYGFSMQADLETLGSRLNAGDLIRESVGTSSGLIIQNSLPDMNSHSPDPADVTGTFWKVIHAVPGTTTSSNTKVPILYYKRFAVDTSGKFIMNDKQPFEDEYILYLDGSTRQLLLRSLANPAAAGTKLKTSCPPPGTASCPSDKLVAENITGVTSRFFSRTGNTINHNSIVDPLTGEYIGPDYQVVDVIELKLNLAKKPLYQSSEVINNSTTIRVALRNT